MALTVYINSVETWTKGFNVQDVINAQPNICTFTLENPATEPVVGVDVSAYDGDTIIFGGIINEIQKTSHVPTEYMYQVICMDYQRLLSRRLVAASYSGQTCQAIIQDIVANYTDPAIGFTTNNTEIGPTVAEIVFNYKPADECIKELADLFAYDWYVDELKDIHFFAHNTELAPYEVSDTTLRTILNDFQLKPDYSQVRNRVVVRGGHYLSDFYVDTQEAVADQTIFKLGYKPSSLTMKVDTVAKTVGVEFLQDETLFDYMMNYTESSVRTSSGTAAPGAGAVMEFTYKYDTPIIVRTNDYVSQAAIAALEGGDGVIEHYVVDPTLSSKEEAYNRAQMELEQFSEAWVSGNFYSDNSKGWKSGQTLTLNVTGETYNGKFQIQRVNIQIIGNNIFRYSVNFSTTLYDLVEFLIGLIKNQKNVKIRDDELVDLLEYVNEDIAVSDSHITSLDAHPAKWGTFKWGLGTWG